eukprot:XP_016664527.1 PREDICTED: uncharacterized protein LOC107885401 [Acyrthosiphon pisum]
MSYKNMPRLQTDRFQIQIQTSTIIETDVISAVLKTTAKMREISQQQMHQSKVELNPHVHLQIIVRMWILTILHYLFIMSKLFVQKSLRLFEAYCCKTNSNVCERHFRTDDKLYRELLINSLMEIVKSLVHSTFQILDTIYQIIQISVLYLIIPVQLMTV